MNTIQLNDIYYRYKNSKNDVLKGISATFERGRLISIVGPSGSGKTTLLSMMAGLDQPTKGQILLDNDDLAQMNLDQYRREKIAMIFQAFHLFPFLTALENVCYPMEQNGMAKKEARNTAKILLENVHLSPEHAKRFPANLSGGEQQRVAIARALSSGAKFIFADEPTGNLDLANGERVLEILRQLAHDHDYCVVIVTHNMDIMAKTDYVYSLRDGLIIEEGGNLHASF